MFDDDNSRYQSKRLVAIGSFALCYIMVGEFIDAKFIMMLCGFIFPWTELLLYREEYLRAFPWELYVFYAYVAFGWLIGYQDLLFFLGMGYALARVIIYFRVRPRKAGV
ncbi:MAG: hypothetical protein ACPGR2_06970 [Psychrobium sp.]